MGVLGEYHQAIGALVHAYEGTLERFTGDGIMVFFNDPIPCDDAAERAVRMALEIRDAVSELAARWLRNGHDLALGIGIAQGFATLGRIGFEGRFDYAAIGSVTNLAARLCSDAGPWQVLVTDRVLAATEHVAVCGNGRRRAAQGIQPHGAGPQHQRARRQAGEHMTQLQAPDQPTTGRQLSAPRRRRALPLLRRSATGDADRLGVDAARLRRRIGRRGPLDQHRAHHPWQRHRHAGDGGTRTVPAAAAPPAAAAHDLRDLAAGVRIDRGVLPRVAARGDSQSCPRPAHPGPGR